MSSGAVVVLVDGMPGVPVFDFGLVGEPDARGTVHLPCGCEIGTEGHVALVMIGTKCRHFSEVGELRRAVPKPKRGDKIGAFRRIVDTATAGKVGACRVDTYSASAVVGVYDRLSADNRAKFTSLDPARMVEVAFQTIARSTQVKP